MKTFLVVLRNKYNDAIVFKTEAPNRLMLVGKYKEPSEYLLIKMCKDTYLFESYDKAQMLACTVQYVEEINNIVTI